jgi:hypothetical protein
MSELLIQMIFAARRQDDTPWMQLLIFVIVAVLYGLGGIIKSRARKLGEKKQEGPGSSGGRPRPAAGRGAQSRASGSQAGRPGADWGGRTQPQSPRRKISRPQPQQRRPAASKKPLAIIRPGVHGLDKEELIVPIARVQGKRRAAGGGRQVSKATAQAPAAEEGPGVPYLGDLLADEAGPDELKKAILYSEIIGKPLCLRNQAGHDIPL